MKEILEYTIFKINNNDFTIGKLLLMLIIILVIYGTLRILKKSIFKYSKLEDSKKYSVFTLVKYFIVFFSVIILLQVAGFDMTLLIAGSTALLVGLGLGIQNLFSDYISGLIILFDSTIKVGDILEIDGLVCQVLGISLRTTQVLTRDDKYIVLPNTNLTRKHIINWTHQKIDSRFEVSVGVDYSSNIHQVIDIMQNCTIGVKSINETPKPFVRFNDFGDSSLKFTIYFWTSEVFRVGNIQSELRCKIFEAFTKNDITIPFPQRVIHIANENY